MSNETCLWEQAEWDGDHFSTSCDREFYMTDGTPTEHNFKFCVFCGKPIFEVLVVVPEDEDDGS